MPRRFAAAFAFILAFAVVHAFAEPASQRSAGRMDSGCDDGWNDSRRASSCEVREATVSGLNPLEIDAGQNGGIHVRGWDRNDVLVRAKIGSYARTDADARRIVSGVRIETAGGRVRADGPPTGGNESWSVSFDVQVPRTAMLTLNTRNGGISIEDFRGTARFHAVNGGVTLNEVGGDIRGETTNGGVTVDVKGDRWDGRRARHRDAQRGDPPDASGQLFCGARDRHHERTGHYRLSGHGPGQSRPVHHHDARRRRRQDARHHHQRRRHRSPAIADTPCHPAGLPWPG